MPTRETHLAAARSHGRRALSQLRNMSADAALHWVLSHRARVAQFRRAIKGTPASKALDQLLARIRSEATPLPRRAPARKARRAHRRHRAAAPRYSMPPMFLGA